MSHADEVLREVGLASAPPDPGPVLPDEFWCTDQLRHIRTGAHSAGLPAAPVLMFADAYLAAGTHYRVQLPARPNYGSLNTTVLAVSESGGNKGSVARQASRLAPLPQDHPCDCGAHTGPEEGDYVVLPVGSGQGLVKSFMSGFSQGAGKNKRTVFRTDRHHVLIDIDEGTTLEVASATSAANPMPVLASLWSGARAGWNNATSDRRLLLAPETYRAVVVAGIQSHRAGPIFDEGAIGVAQRTLWTPTVGVDVPDLDAGQDLPAWPGPLDLDPAVLRPVGDDPVVIEVHPAVAREVQLRHNRRTRGVDVVDRLDTHRDFNQLRVAARLGLLHGQYRVTEQWWHLAGLVLDLSDATRSQVLEVLALERQRANRRKGAGEGERRMAAAEVVAGHVDKAAGALQRLIRQHANPDVDDRAVNRSHRPGEPCTSRCVAFALRHFPNLERDVVVLRAEHLEWIVRVLRADGRDGWLPGPSQPSDTPL